MLLVKILNLKIYRFRGFWKPFSNYYMMVQAPQQAVSKAATIVKRLQDLASGAMTYFNFSFYADFYNATSIHVGF